MWDVISAFWLQHAPVLSVLLPVFTAVGLLLIGDSASSGGTGADGRQRWGARLSMASVLLGLFMAVQLVRHASGGELLVYQLGEWPAPFGIVLVLDRLSALMVLLTYLVAVPVLWYATGGWDTRGRHFHALFQFQLMGLCGAFLTGDLFNLFEFRQLDAVAKPGAILASNTSYLDIDRIATFTRRPQDVIGLHFFSPANVMRLLEIVRGAQTAPDVLATSLQLAKQIKKVAVVSGVCDGFIGNRMLARYGAAAQGLINAGALPQQIDGALQKFGLAMGPFRMGDLAGLDIGWATRKRKAVEAGVEMKPIVADKLCEAGRFGQKTGAGWYRYEAGNRTPLPDSVTEQLIADYRAAHGITPRKISDEEIVERCIFALVNEGARILEEGIAARASDIDLVYLNGYGFPLHRGGPMLYADTVGLPQVVRSLRRFAAEPGADGSWQPAPLLVRLAEEGRSFN